MNLDIDPQMRYCLKCNDEYMPERSTCGVCGAALLTGTEMLAQRQSSRQQTASRKGALTPADDIITIFKASLLDVKRLEVQLQRENIGVLIWGDKPSCGKGCCGGGDLELRVRREDATAAMAIVEADFARQTASHGIHNAVADYGFDPEGGENSCPACGCTFAADGSQALTCPDCGLCFG
jgi:uncharacterized Zn ribbon protein